MSENSSDVLTFKTRNAGESDKRVAVVVHEAVGLCGASYTISECKDGSCSLEASEGSDPPFFVRVFLLDATIAKRVAVVVEAHLRDGGEDSSEYEVSTFDDVAYEDTLYVHSRKEDRTFYEIVEYPEAP